MFLKGTLNFLVEFFCRVELIKVLLDLLPLRMFVLLGVKDSCSKSKTSCKSSTDSSRSSFYCDCL